MAAFTTHGATFDGTLGLVLGCRESDSSAVVVSVKTGGAASTQGVAVGDVIARVNGRRAGDYDGVPLPDEERTEKDERINLIRK